MAAAFQAKVTRSIGVTLPEGAVEEDVVQLVALQLRYIRAISYDPPLLSIRFSTPVAVKRVMDVLRAACDGPCSLHSTCDVPFARVVYGEMCALGRPPAQEGGQAPKAEDEPAREPGSRVTRSVLFCLTKGLAPQELRGVVELVLLQVGGVRAISYRARQLAISFHKPSSVPRVQAAVAAATGDQGITFKVKGVTFPRVVYGSLAKKGRPFVVPDVDATPMTFPAPLVTPPRADPKYAPLPLRTPRKK